MVFPWNKYPYTDFHELNLTWVLEQINKLSEDMRNFIKFNTIKYADPIAWNITTQYEANTVVIDQNTGVAYLSVAPVPSGVVITDTDYWVDIFDLSPFFESIGNLQDLLTTDKSTIVNAINEIFNTVKYLNIFATPQMFGAKADGVHDDSEAIQAAVNSNNTVIFTSGTYTINTPIELHDDLTIIGFGATIKKNPTSHRYVFYGDNLKNVKVEGLGFDSTKVDGDAIFLVYMYHQHCDKLEISNCKFRNGSAAIGLWNTHNARIHDNVITNMFQFPSDHAEFPNVYGYGVALDACYDCDIYNNTLGTDDEPIDRHSIYITKTLVSPQTDTESNSNINIHGNTITQLNYSLIIPQTLAEHCIKIISGTSVNVYGNSIKGGYGAFLVTAEESGNGVINISDNVYDGRYYFIRCVNGSVQESYDIVNLENNIAVLDAPYACAVDFENVKRLMSSNNKFIATDADNFYCFLEGEHNTALGYQKCELFNSKDDYIEGFKGVLRCNNIDDVIYDSYSDITPGTTYVPFDLVTSDYRDIKYDNRQYYDFLTHFSSIPNGFSFYCGAPFVSVVKKIDDHLLNADGLIIADTSRPSAYPYNYPFYEFSSGLTLFMTQYSWTTSNVGIVTSMTRDQLLAFNPTTEYGASYCSIPIYNRDDKKPYWFDAYYQVWKDASGTQLT